MMNKIIEYKKLIGLSITVFICLFIGCGRETISDANVVHEDKEAVETNMFSLSLSELDESGTDSSGDEKKESSRNKENAVMFEHYSGTVEINSNFSQIENSADEEKVEASFSQDENGSNLAEYMESNLYQGDISPNVAENIEVNISQEKIKPNIAANIEVNLPKEDIRPNIASNIEVNLPQGDIKPNSSEKIIAGTDVGLDGEKKVYSNFPTDKDDEASIDNTNLNSIKIYSQENRKELKTNGNKEMVTENFPKDLKQTPVQK